MTQQLTTHESEWFSKTSWDIMKPMAESFKAAGALPTAVTMPQIVMMLQAGKEQGLKPAESLNAFYWINGRLAQYGKSQLAQLKRKGYKVAWPEVSQDKVSVKITDPDNIEHVETFTMADATRAGLTSKPGPWKQYPQNMLRWRALNNAVNFFCPDVCGGIPQVEDIRDVEERRSVPTGTDEAEKVDAETLIAQLGEADSQERLAELEAEAAKSIRSFDPEEQRLVRTAIMVARAKFAETPAEAEVVTRAPAAEEGGES